MREKHELFKTGKVNAKVTGEYNILPVKCLKDNNTANFERGFGGKLFFARKSFPPTGSKGRALGGVQGQSSCWEVWRAKPSNILWEQKR